MKVTAAAQKRAIGLWQTALERKGQAAALRFTKLLVDARKSPAWTDEALRDAMKSIFLAYSTELGSPMNAVLLASVAAVLPAGTTSVDFQQEDGWLDSLNTAAARAIQQRTPVEGAEVMRVALIDHATAQLEATQTHYLEPGPKTVRVKDRETTYINEAQPRGGAKLMWERVHEPGACSWCTSEVWQLQEQSWSFSRHHGDRCTRRLVSRPVGTQPR